MADLNARDRKLLYVLWSCTHTSAGIQWSSADLVQRMSRDKSIGLTVQGTGMVLSRLARAGHCDRRVGPCGMEYRNLGPACPECGTFPVAVEESTVTVQRVGESGVRTEPGTARGVPLTLVCRDGHYFNFDGEPAGPPREITIREEPVDG